MGVHGLWELLAPVGRRVSVETLAGKKLAIDASIWLVQFMKAMRDDKGEMVRNAHLIGFFRRICKLLFLRTKPVFVFDGATPALKRRTVIARRRQRENAQAKIRKTAEKLLLNHLKSMRLKELANDIENQRLSNDAKGKKVISDHSEVSHKNEGNESDIFRKHDQEHLDEMLAASIAAEEDERLTNMASTSKAIPSDDDDGIEEMIFPDNFEEVDDAMLNALPPDLLVKMRRRCGTRDSTNHDKLDISKQNAQEKLDAMLAASIAAEEDSYVTNNATAPSAEVLSDEEDGDGDDEMILPEEMQGAVDRAVLDSLPLSMRLDLFAQMKERQMAENRQKYQKVKKAPEKFSELQIQSYLKSVALRREINQVQKAASGIGVDGVQTSRIASEANKKFIFSSSFTGDKEMLASSRADRNKDGENPKTTKHVSSECSSGLPSTSKSDKISELVASKSKSKSNFEDGVETFLDEQGRVRVSRVRAMGIRMTRDLQRNLELMKEIEKDQAPASNIETLFRSIVDKRENENLPESRGDANCETVQLDENKEQGVGRNETLLQISFEDDGDNKSLDGDDEIFSRLVTETSVQLSSPEKCTSAVDISDSDSGWEEGIVDCFPQDQSAEVRASNEDMNADSEVEWEDGISASEYENPISKGSLEEDAELQEAIRRSLKEQKIHVAPNENVKKQTEGESSSIHTFAPASEITSLSQSASFSLTGQISAVSDCSSKLNCQRGTAFSQIADSLEEQEPHSFKLLRVADESSQVVQGSHFDISNQGDNMPKSEIIPELTQQLESDEKQLKTEEQRNVSAENCQISAPADSHVKGSPFPTDMSGKTVSVDKSQNAKLVDSSITVSSNSFDTKQSEPDKGDFMEARTVEASNIETIKSNLDEEMRKLDQEYMDLGNEQKKHERDAESVNSEMFTECQELLQMFGLPYIIAPMEAEAQCAHLELTNLVDGVVTDDSDVLLFGAQNVYKNIFDDRKYVERYFLKDIEKEFGLSREKLIRMALLLGSDYTEGISGIGIVNAIEVLNAFPEDDGLEKFREWIESPDPSILGKSDKRKMKRGSGDQNHVEELKQHFMETHRNVSKNWHIPPNFPSEVVVSAYSAPQVDKSAEPFSWGQPDIFLLRKLCWERFGWNGQKADELLVPVLNEYNKHETQLRMEAFYSFNEKFAKIRSKRIKKAVKGITGGQPSEPKDESSKAATKNVRKRRATAGESSVNKEMPSGEEEILGQNESRTDQSKKRRAKGKSEVGDSEASKRARGGKTARGRGGRKTRNGKDATAAFDSDETNSWDDNDFLEIPAETFIGLQEVRRSERSRKTVDYSMGESDNDRKSKSSMDASEQHHSVDGETGCRDWEGGGFCADEQKPDKEEASEADYVKAGGGFCMEDEEEENTGVDLDAAAAAAYNNHSEDVSAERDDKDGSGLAYSVTQHKSDLEKCMEEGDKDKNPCLVPAGALTAMPFLRRKRKKKT